MPKSKLSKKNSLYWGVVLERLYAFGATPFFVQMDIAQEAKVDFLFAIDDFFGVEFVGEGK